MKERVGGNPDGHELSLGEPRVLKLAQGLQVVSLHGGCLRQVLVSGLLCVHLVVLNADTCDLYTRETGGLESGESARVEGSSLIILDLGALGRGLATVGSGWEGELEGRAGTVGGTERKGQRGVGRWVWRRAQGSGRGVRLVRALFIPQEIASDLAACSYVPMPSSLMAKLVEESLSPC